MAVEVWALALLVTAGAAYVQGTVGTGYAVVGVPILVLVDPQLAPVPQLLTALPLMLLMLWKERTAIDLSGAGWVVAGRLPGAAIGVILLGVATQQVLEFFIGLIVLLGVGILASGATIVRNPYTQFGAGLASGVTGLIASIGGPPTALLYSTSEAPTIRSTLAGVFSIGITLSIAVRYLSGNATARDLEIALILFPAALAGWWVSTLTKDRIPKARIRIAVLTISALAALGLLVQALL